VRDLAFGLTMTGMGMGVTITTLAILILVIRLLIRFFPFKEKGDEK
jgi:Na+-transporting methylmalonyl-CoA/oxaloacetate decarboxylase gamma subunit